MAALLSTSCASAISRPVPDFQTSEAGNPFVEGWYADPDNEFYNGEYWVYSTYSHPYDEQTHLDAFSSPDLVHWKKHPNVLVADDFSWAHRAVWAPAPIYRNGKYYLYFGANDIQSNNELGGIGVGVADRPEGPYKDAIGKPLIGKYYNGAQPIDQDVFLDDDGQAYIYYGGHGHANVAKLNEDMISFGTFENGEIFKEITPQNYVEGSQMLKRNGKYYFFWSEGGWTGPDYAVSYAIADSPLGPFKRLDKILQLDSAVATGAGHNGVINVPGTDIHYIVYHRHPLGSTDGNDRHLSYDRLRFREDGTIKPVILRVHDNFNDGNMIAWTQYGGSWDPSSNALKTGFSFGGKAMLNTNFEDQYFGVDVTIPTTNGGDAGIVFRASDVGEGTDSYRGYYLGIGTSGKVVLGRASYNWTVLKEVQADIRPGQTYRVSINAKGDNIEVAVSHGNDVIKFSVRDGTFASGKNGVRAFQTEATFDNVVVSHGC
ncbi:hypothetical protein K4F52_001429 [Lecanicillium sp. MT-2017a]|nr:hypothetical protein K4F52_001429 [Lecanicillium sp. MT-2017a]